MPSLKNRIALGYRGPSGIGRAIALNLQVRVRRSFGSISNPVAAQSTAVLIKDAGGLARQKDMDTSDEDASRTLWNRSLRKIRSSGPFSSITLVS